MLARTLFIISILSFMGAQNSSASVECLLGKFRDKLNANRTTAVVVDAPPLTSPSKNIYPTPAEKSKSSSLRILGSETSESSLQNQTTTSRREAKKQQYAREEDVVVQPKGFVTSVQPASVDEAYRYPSPGLKGDPYNAEAVKDRQDSFQKKYADQSESLQVTEMMDLGKKSHFRSWFNSLDHATQLRVEARMERVKKGELGDTKPVRSGIYELRLAFGAGYRIYYMKTRQGIILLTAGDKSTQDEDILSAVSLFDQNTKTKSP